MPPYRKAHLNEQVVCMRRFVYQSRYLLLWGITTLGLVGGVSGCSRQPPASQAQGPMGVPVKFEVLQARTLETVTEYVGVLEADQIVTLKPEIDGLVRQILVQEGEFVSVGRPILTLKSEQDEASLQQAIANVEAAKAAQQNAEAQLSAVQAERIESQADLKLRQQDLKRVQELVDEGALPERELDQSQRDLEVAEARVNTIQQRIQAAEANISQAKANLQQVKSSVVIANENLKESTINAPVAGQVGDLSIKVGDYVEQGDTLTIITQNQSLSLNFFVPIEQAPNLRAGLPVELFDYRTLQTVGVGAVSFISPEVDFTSQTILAKASFDNPDQNLFTGQLVKAKVIWQKQAGVSAPVTSITRVGGETFVFVMENNPNAEGDNAPEFVAVQKPVTLGKIDGNRYQVISGLSIGEKLITTGILNLNDGVPVIPENSTVF